MHELITSMRSKLSNMDIATAGPEELAELETLSKDTTEAIEILTKKLAELDEIDEQIEERKKRWIVFDAESGQRYDMISELGGLMDANGELYSLYCIAVDKSGALKLGLSDVNEAQHEHVDYELKQGLIEKALGKLREIDMAQWETKKGSYGEELESLQKYDDVTLKNLSGEELTAVLERATALNKNLEEDHGTVGGMADGLGSDRTALGDADLHEIAEVKTAKLAKQEEGMASTQALLDELQSGITAAKEDGSGGDISKVEADFDAAIVRYNELVPLMVEVRNLNVKVQEMVNAHVLETSECSYLVEIIIILRTLSAKLLQASGELSSLTSALQVAQAKLGGADGAKKLREILEVITEFRERLLLVEADIEKLIRLAQELDGFTSDDEEAYFVEHLVEELNAVKVKIQFAREECDQLEKEAKEITIWLEEKNSKHEDLTDEELADLVSKIHSIEDRLEKADNSEIERIVDSKKQRFAEMDVYAKFERREKELKLRDIIDQRHKIVSELLRDVAEDLKTENPPEELKDIQADAEQHMIKIEECYATCDLSLIHI